MASSTSSSSVAKKPAKKKAASSSSSSSSGAKKESSRQSSSSTYERPDFYPEKVQKILLAARNFQRKQADLEKEFYKKMCDVKKAMYPKFKDIWIQRAKLINGTKEPKSEDVVVDGDWKKNHVFKDEKLRNRQQTKFKGDYKGVPEFWLSVLLSAMPTSNMIEKHDLPALRKLKDIRLSLIDDETEAKGFTISFDFGENDYFKESTISKTYYLQPSVNLKSKKASPPMQFEANVIKYTEVVAPTWKKEDNPQTKMVTKTYLNKANGHKKQMTKPEKRQSFFQFFTGVKVEKPKKEEDEDSKDKKKRKNAEEQQREILTIDYELATFFKDKLIPRAVLYYTGEAQDYNDDEGGYDRRGGYDDYDDVDWEKEMKKYGGRGGRRGKDRDYYDDDDYSDYDRKYRKKHKKKDRSRKAKKSSKKKSDKKKDKKAKSSDSSS